MHKRTAIVSAVSLAVAGGLSAAAFISATSTGIGHAAQGTEAPHITTTVAVPTVNFGQSGTVTISVHNDSTHVSVTPKTVTVDSVTWAGSPTCPAGSFTVTGLSSSLPFAIAPSTGAQVATATLNFRDLGGASNEQTGCLGADVAVSATASS